MAEGKGAQVLVLDPPQELLFKGPYTDIVVRPLKLKNPTDKAICFKVKTTAPKQYCVRPNSGMIQPNEATEVQVMLQPMESLPDDHTKHKFMVQTCYAPSPDVDLDGLWKTANSSDLMFTKLRVVFDHPAFNKAAPRAQEESPVMVQHNNPVGTAPASKVIDLSSPLYSPTVTSTPIKVTNSENELTHERQLRQKAEADVAALKKDFDEMMKKHMLLQQGQVVSDGGISQIQIILIAITGLLVGLIFGKLF